MGLFGKSKKNTSCCYIQIEEVKEDKKKNSSCCDIKIEEVTEDKASDKSNETSS